MQSRLVLWHSVHTAVGTIESQTDSTQLLGNFPSETTLNLFPQLSQLPLCSLWLIWTKNRNKNAPANIHLENNEKVFHTYKENFFLPLSHPAVWVRRSIYLFGRQVRLTCEELPVAQASLSDSFCINIETGV